ncbi:spermidine/putrescine ABC transporter ATP-binding protein [Spiroplasma sp. TIUS-1]|uniref:spermidine/putrescine ABC transporter ATP-binding protein n=1 Tax=Spiroplasma sp. TIUS-1 TaxID=216963 RepID=UPI001398E0F3|nr:spermidine/putrescine ABC transporter ATP-binding protein [Spiroplasma sp. TIUS-1]QHX35671.1 spermidine/putrescine ABC transporter ATP-binding protein [Spiroplasma sp. TIUS-1]
MNKTILEIRDLTKQYDGKVILKGISFNVREGEFVTLLGPSGCGKSTTLNIIAGRENPNSGDLLFEGKDLTKIPTNKREINTIFQSYALFPHYDVFENIAYGLRIKKTKEHIVQEEVGAYIKKMGLAGFEHKRVQDLSGGQRQRVAIARALILKPRILLLDEPLAALDVQLKRRMQDELKELQEQVGITFVLVTHDQEEALTLSDRIVILNDGIIKQIGTPQSVYNEPENKWVANFIGKSNIIENGIFIEDEKVSFDDKTFACHDKGFGKNEASVDIVIRPEDIVIGEKAKGYFDGVVEDVVFKGTVYEYVIKTQHRTFMVQTTQFFDFDTEVSIKWEKDDIHVMWKEIDE